VTLDLSVPQLVSWRLGMAHTAPFVARLSDAACTALVAEAEEAVAAVAEPVHMGVVLLDARA
jgi:hypothetical protein